jgi:hypothetical protein
MGRRVIAKIEFSFDEDVINDGVEDATPMTDEELHAYAVDTFVEDVYSFVKYNELASAVRTEIQTEGKNE